MSYGIGRNKSFCIYPRSTLWTLVKSDCQAVAYTDESSNSNHLKGYQSRISVVSELTSGLRPWPSASSSIIYSRKFHFSHGLRASFDVHRSTALALIRSSEYGDDIKVEVQTRHDSSVVAQSQSSDTTRSAEGWISRR